MNSERPIPFGPFLFYPQKKLLLCKQNRLHFPRNPMTALEFVIQHRDRVVTYEELIEAIWGKDDKTGKTKKDVRKTVSRYFKLLTFKGHAFIETVTQYGYRFMPLPGEVAQSIGSERKDSVTSGLSLPADRETAIDETGVVDSDSRLPSELSSGLHRDFTLIVDGMIINSVSELIHEDKETDRIRKTCFNSYERSLEDLAFAAVYASRLVTSKDFRPSLTTPDQPGQEVAARLREICEQRAYPSYITDGRLLRMGATRDGIRADIQGLAKCVTDRQSVHFFRDYMVREAAKHLGKHDTVFQEDFAPDKYKFDVEKLYYTDRELQDALGTEATKILVGFLPKSPLNSKDLYAENALREFATRNVLSLITIMWEGEVYAKETEAWRMPHVLRALVMRQRSNDRAGTQHQEFLRSFAVEHALTAALRQTRRKTRHNLMAALLNIRDDRPFKQFREVLNQHHMMFVKPDTQREKDARRVLRQLKDLAVPTLIQPDKIHLAHGAALRISNSPTAADYEYEIARVFPELRPNNN